MKIHNNNKMMTKDELTKYRLSLVDDDLKKYWVKYIQPELIKNGECNIIPFHDKPAGIKKLTKLLGYNYTNHYIY